QAVANERHDGVEVRRATSIVLQLPFDPFPPAPAVNDLNVADPRLARMAHERRDDVLPPAHWVEDPIPVHPAVARVLGGIEDDPLVDAADEVEVPEVREQV